MVSGFNRYLRSKFNRYFSVIAVVFWVCAMIAAVTWFFVPTAASGWDLHVYASAIHSLRMGHDPYLDAIAVQRIFHAHLAEHPNAPPPFSYVYSPITLPLLKWLGGFPLQWVARVYWLLYACCTVAAVWVGMQAIETEERNVFLLLAPAAFFFPGLLENDVFLSGNIAYVIYGLIFVTAMLGWRRGQWMWFYLVAIAASCCKAPMLTLLAIPVLSSRKQWWPAGLAAACGVGVFAVQPLLWPSTFQHYLTAVELQFSYNRDFSCSPAGLLADALFNVIPYKVTSGAFYLFYAIPVFAILFYLSRRYLDGEFSFGQWLPVLLTGVILLNPRIMEYDVAAIALPMALIAWRMFARDNTLGRTILEMSLFVAFVNSFSRSDWRSGECLSLVGIFAAGSWNLYAQLQRAGYRSTVVASEDEGSMLVGAQM
jgi:hypothetical protein